MAQIPRVKFDGLREYFSVFAIRQAAAAVQRIWVTLRQFDKRATDPY
jgi:hypothetical protein